MPDLDTEPKKITPPPLSRNIVSYLGWLIFLSMLALLGVLVATDILFYSQEAYKGIITYMVLPGVLVFGVSLILLGSLIEWRRRHKKHPGEYPKLPVVDVNVPWQRRRIAIATFMLTIFFGISAVGVYQSYHYTESPEFCGLVCHQVMEPEYTAYQYSPHSRVACTDCHIGPGAQWFVKAKISGLRQVYAVATNTYHLPISVPVENLRPAQGTCEQCHWPEKFFDSLEKVVWHFSPDQSNTPSRYNLLLNIGGGDASLGQGRGIHWHSGKEVKIHYWARDKKRSDIPWVKVQVGDEEAIEYRSPDCPTELPQDAEIRLMDCIDCHNRPSHVYQSPRKLIDTALGNGFLDGSLPYLKRHATTLFEQKYETKVNALETIGKELRTVYAKRMVGPNGKAQVERNIKGLQELYSRNFFPDHKVDWREYPNNLGHYEFQGCERCHDGKHDTTASIEEKSISNDCSLCHNLVDQAIGEAAFKPPVYERREFVHPRHLDTVWEGKACTECHGLNVKEEKRDKEGNDFWNEDELSTQSLVSIVPPV